MKIFKRVTDIFSANLNDLIDHCENPERMLRQAIREMETASGQAMDGAARAIAHERLLTRQLNEQNKCINQCLKSAESFVRKKDDSAARRQLQSKLEHEQLAESLTEQVKKATDLSNRLRNQVSAMRIKLNDAKQKMLDITARNRAAQAQLSFASSFESSINTAAIGTNFDRIYARIEQDEAQTEALLELLAENEETIIPDDRITEELNALKEKTDDASY